MQIWQEEDEFVQEENGGCCGLSAVDDARRVAQMIGIPHYVMNFRKDFKDKVIDYFCEEYLNARTPNPCIACNRYVKWESLLKRCLDIGADYIATGHYSQITKLDNGRYALKCSKTQKKDQTYALYNLTQNQLSKTLMPIGAYTKDEVRQIAEEIGLLVANKPDSQDICFVDDNYGEFIEDKEPTQVGADLMAGSLIKNLGGGIAPTGGYIVGRKDLVELASYRLTAPGLGGEMGATLGDTAREFYEGLFFAPHVVLQAIKTSIFAASVFQNLGFEVSPLPEERRSDIIQTITLKTKENLCRFCEAIQASSPVDAHVTPVPSHLPGYQDEVIMAAGTFVQGASIELSADAPVREPFTVYLQGGLTFEHGHIAIMEAARKIMDK